MEWTAVVNDLKLDEETAHVHRELEGDVEELTDIELPAVLTIQTGINEPRYASLRGIRQAQGKEIARKSPADLGLDSVESDLELVEMYEPEVKSHATVFEGSPEDTAGELTEVLRERGIGA